MESKLFYARLGESQDDVRDYGEWTGNKKLFAQLLEGSDLILVSKKDPEEIIRMLPLLQQCIEGTVRGTSVPGIWLGDLRSEHIAEEEPVFDPSAHLEDYKRPYPLPSGVSDSTPTVEEEPWDPAKHLEDVKRITPIR